MSITFTPKTILYFLALLWIVFSLIYIPWSAWQNYKNIQMAGAYNQGILDLVNQLFLEAEKCQPIPITDGITELYLIDIACLEQASSEPLPEPLLESLP